jgi:hypothetical protein
MSNDTIKLKVVVEYECDNMLDKDTLETVFQNDARAAYDFIGDRDKKTGRVDHPLNFTDKWEIKNVEAV